MYQSAMLIAAAMSSVRTCGRASVEIFVNLIVENSALKLAIQIGSACALL
jgi:hypothetical protein